MTGSYEYVVESPTILHPRAFGSIRAARHFIRNNLPQNARYTIYRQVIQRQLVQFGTVGEHT